MSPVNSFKFQRPAAQKYRQGNRMILNDFDACQEALRKIDLSEAALPIYHGRFLNENADVYCKL